MTNLDRAAEELSRDLDAGDGPAWGLPRTAKERALAALAAAVEERCEGCIAHAVRRAAHAGAARREVAAAARRAVAASRGPTLVYAAEALVAFDALAPAPRTVAAPASVSIKPAPSNVAMARTRPARASAPREATLHALAAGAD